MYDSLWELGKLILEEYGEKVTVTFETKPNPIAWNGHTIPDSECTILTIKDKDPEGETIIWLTCVSNGEVVDTIDPSGLGSKPQFVFSMMKELGYFGLLG